MHALPWCERDVFTNCHRTRALPWTPRVSIAPKCHAEPSPPIWCTCTCAARSDNTPRLDRNANQRARASQCTRVAPGAHQWVGRCEWVCWVWGVSSSCIHAAHDTVSNNRVQMYVCATSTTTRRTLSHDFHIAGHDEGRPSGTKYKFGLCLGGLAHTLCGGAAGASYTRERASQSCSHVRPSQAH
jgi:hypothetical protein